MKKLMLKTGLLFAVIILVFSSVGTTQPVSAQTGGTTVCVVEKPIITGFPDVSVEFRVVDENLNNITNLNQSQVQVKEEGSLYNPQSLVKSAKGTGLNLYFVIDRGNRTDPISVKGVLQRFAEKFAEDGLDKISVISTDFSESETMRVFGSSSSVTNFKSFITNLSSISLKEPRSAVKGIQAAVNLIRADNYGCSVPNVIIAITGEDVLAQPTEYRNAISGAVASNTQVYVVHLTNKGTTGEEDFEKLAADTKGLYLPVGSMTSASSNLDTNLFAALTNARFTYTMQYRTQGGMSGERNLSLVVNGVESTAKSASTVYSVDLEAPQVTIANPINDAKITRTATDFREPDYIYDNDTELVQWSITWPDGYERETTAIRIITMTDTGEQAIGDLKNSTNYQYEWDLKGIKEKGSNPVTLRIEVTDELGLTGVSGTVNVNIENYIPKEIEGGTTIVIVEKLHWLVYALYGLIGLLLLLAIIFRKKIKHAFSAQGAIGGAIENVRKTIVGGRGHRRNPIAKLEVLRPTQETKSIFTESVKLGRDPSLADYTFFSLNSECSVSGEHAHLVKRRDGWVIVGVSASKSPVFVDGQLINLHEEVPLKDGQIVELGYEDLGSAMFRFVELKPVDAPNFFTPEEAVPDQDEQGYRKTQVLIQDVPGEDGATKETNVLLGELDTFNDITRDQDDFDLLFDDLRSDK